MNLSIAIVNYRSSELLGHCLKSLLKNSSLPYKVLVVDNDPTDSSVERICGQFPAVQLIRNDRNEGFARAINTAFRKTSGKFFLILNPDIEVKNGSIEILMDYMEQNSEVGLVAPKLVSEDGSLQYSCRTDYTVAAILFRRTILGTLFPDHPIIKEHLMSEWDHSNIREVDWVLGAAMMLRREACQNNIVFDERFFLYFEDVDLCLSLRKRGWKVVYNPSAVMLHHHRRASKHGILSVAKLEHLKSWIKFELKHRSLHF